MVSKIYVGLLWLVLLTACESTGPSAETSSIYMTPEASVGSQVRLCGNLVYAPEDHNIYATSADLRAKANGLGVVPGKTDHQALVAHNGKLVCVSATIIRRGCARDRICSDSNFEYAAKVIEILPELASSR